MKKLFYCSFLIMATVMTFNGCKKTVKGCTDSTATNYDPKANKDDGSCKHTPPGPVIPSNNYVTFTLNGPGFVNRVFLFQTGADKPAGHDVYQNEYTETNASPPLIGFNLNCGKGDTLIQIRLSDNTTGYKNFVQGAVFFSFTNIGAINPLEATSDAGGYTITTFTPTHLVQNGSSGAWKGKAALDATFSGSLTESTTGDTYTVTGGHVKLDGN